MALTGPSPPPSAVELITDKGGVTFKLIRCFQVCVCACVCAYVYVHVGEKHKGHSFQ